jgi:hypothetical protein
LCLWLLRIYESVSLSLEIVDWCTSLSLPLSFILFLLHRLSLFSRVPTAHKINLLIFSHRFLFAGSMKLIVIYRRNYEW